MKIIIHYWDELLSNPEYVRVLKHEAIHTKLNSLLKKYMMPIIEVIPHEEKESIWFEGKCRFNFIFKQISFLLFIKIFLCTFADSLFDFISYILEPKMNKIFEMVIKNSIFIAYYLLRALNIIKIESHLKIYNQSKNHSKYAKLSDTFRS